MKYKGKYRAYIGLIDHESIQKFEAVQLGTMTTKKAKKERKRWKNLGFDWIIWRKPTREELKKAKLYKPIYEKIPNPLNKEK